MKKANASLYTKGRFGKVYGKTLDTDNKYLYSSGRFPTKITEEDLPEYYCRINDRAIWYMDGFVKTANVKDITYCHSSGPYLFQDDYIYLSYKDPISLQETRHDYFEYVNFDVRICGDDIIPVLFFIEKYSPDISTSYVRDQILARFQLYKKLHYDEYRKQFEDDTDIFKYYEQFMDNHIIKK